MGKIRFLLPLAIFLVVAAFLVRGLFLNPREVPSPLIDKPAPGFSLVQLHAPDKTLTREDLKGQVWLFNVWASWCVSCREEHPLLVELSRQGLVPIYGLNYKDKREDALGWLQQFGNPYTASVVDLDGRVGINYGVYGVPETFVVDKSGVIRFKQIGPVTRDALDKKIIPLVKQLQQS